MIRNEKLKVLTEDELSLLGFVVNFYPTEKSREITSENLSSIRLEIIIPYLNSLKNNLTEDGKKVLDSLLKKII